MAVVVVVEGACVVVDDDVVVVMVVVVGFVMEMDVVALFVAVQQLAVPDDTEHAQQQQLWQ